MSNRWNQTPSLICMVNYIRQLAMKVKIHMKGNLPGGVGSPRDNNPESNLALAAERAPAEEQKAHIEE